jgi:hypothetical protein
VLELARVMPVAMQARAKIAMKQWMPSLKKSKTTNRRQIKGIKYAGLLELSESG